MTGTIQKFFLRNYKSIGEATVELPRFCVFIGPNASGKSNFVDALSFVRDCLSDSIQSAFRNRGGIGAVRRKSGGHPTHIGLRLIVSLDDGSSADYAFEIAAKKGERFSVAKERCVIQPIMQEPISFVVRDGKFAQPIPGIRPQVASDRLALFAAAGIEDFAPLFEFLTRIRTYSIFPTRLRELQEPGSGEFLTRDGSNAAAILRRLGDEDPDRYEQLCRLLGKIAPGLRTVEYKAVGKAETLQFRQEVGLRAPWKFDADNMSDGTLRVLGVLLAVYQPTRPSVVAIEEPEATVNPAVMELLVQVLLEASRDQQVLLTTHSPDILDYEEIGDEQLRVVVSEKNATIIAPVAGVKRDAIRDRLYTPGELLRIGELTPDMRAAGELAEEASNLFSPVQLQLAGVTDSGDRSDS